MTTSSSARDQAITNAGPEPSRRVRGIDAARVPLYSIPLGVYRRYVMELVNFMQTSVGRSMRAVLGVALIAAGVVLGGGWLALAVVGLVPLVAGSAGVCLVAPLFHGPIRGAHRS